MNTNKRYMEWARNMIELWDEPFTAIYLRERLVDKPGTTCIPCASAIASFLKRNCNVVGKHDGRYLYRRRNTNGV